MPDGDGCRLPDRAGAAVVSSAAQDVRGRAPRELMILLAVTFLAFVNYAATLSVVPLWAATGGAGSTAVGATTGVMMAATVASQLTMPWMFRILSLRLMMILGAVLLGAPTPLYLLASDIAPIMMITIVRGIGFALVVIAGATLVADLAAEGALARSASSYGAAAALPNVGALAGGVWIAQSWGFTVVFVSAGVACLLSAIAAFALPTGHHGTFQRASMADVRRIAVPISLFLMTAASFGAATTFVPVAVPLPIVSSIALLAASVALVLARLGAGIIGDRYGTGTLLPVSVLSCAVGLVLIALALPDQSVLLILGATLLGCGFGACQNDSFVVTIQRFGNGQSGTASTIWNIAYDGGLGLGAVVLGGVIANAGYAQALIAMAVTISVVALALSWVGATRRH